jgi:hypothetical protein
MSGYYDIVTHRRAISTSSPDARIWFERGLIWTYAFNHEEAMRCYERASSHDPGCPLWNQSPRRSVNQTHGRSTHSERQRPCRRDT